MTLAYILKVSVSQNQKISALLWSKEKQNKFWI